MAENVRPWFSNRPEQQAGRGGIVLNMSGFGPSW